MSLPEPLFDHQTIMIPVEPEPVRPASIRVPRPESTDDDQTPELTTCETGD